MRSRYVHRFVFVVAVISGLYIHFATSGDVATHESRRNELNEQSRSPASVASVEPGDEADLNLAGDRSGPAGEAGQAPASPVDAAVSSNGHAKWQGARSDLLAKAALCKSVPGAACEKYHRALGAYYFTFSKGLLAAAAVDEVEELLLFLEEACRAGQFASCTQTYRMAGLIGDDGRRQSMVALMTERCEGSSEESRGAAYCAFLAMILMEDGNLSEADRMASIGCGKKSLGSCFVRTSVQYAIDFDGGFPKALMDLCHLYEKDGGEMTDPRQICSQLKGGDLAGRDLPDGYLRMTYEFSRGKPISISKLAGLYYGRNVK